MSYTNYSFLFKCLAANTSEKSANPNDALSIEEIPRDYATFKILLRGVGGPWLWHLRPKYAEEEGIKALKKRLIDPESHLYLLKEFDRTAGYCFTINRPNLTDQYGVKTAEIENFGLALPYTGKNYGGYFLQGVFQCLHEEQFISGWLGSRSTNHKRVPDFYEGQGMELTNIQHDIPDDVPAYSKNCSLDARRLG